MWNEAGRAIALVVTPPWWATWWFRGLALALIVGCATGVYAWRVSSLKRRRRALEGEIAERKQVEEALRASNRQIQDLAGRLITAQEAERARIARELHDDVTQQLAALSISLSGLKRRLPPDLTEAAVGVRRSSAASARGVRDDPAPVARVAPRPCSSTSGSSRRSRGAAPNSAACTKIEVVFHADEGLQEIPPDVALCLYRVAQEALHNTARHAQARRVDVALTCSREGAWS